MKWSLLCAAAVLIVLIVDSELLRQFKLKKLSTPQTALRMILKVVHDHREWHALMTNSRAVNSGHRGTQL